MVDLSKPHQYLLTPTAFNNFYKGVIGEKIFALVAEKYRLDWHDMSDLEKDKFELVDGFLKRGIRQIYVDVKNFDSRKRAYFESEAAFERKERYKLERLKTKRIVIVNLYDWEGKEYPGNSKDWIIYYPALFQNDGTLNRSVVDSLSSLLNEEE